MIAKSVHAKGLYITAANQLQWLDEVFPSLGPHDVLVQTRTGSISIGSELSCYRNGIQTTDTMQYPHMTGYESVGIVLVCGEQVSRPGVGDRVVAFYGHRTHRVVPASQVLIVPDGVSDALAVLAILTCDVAKGVRKVVPRPEEPVLITGGGAIGLLTLFILKAYGVATVDVVEARPERHALALKLGARQAVLPQDVSVMSESYAVAFECSGRNAAFTLMQNNMLPHGRICVLSDGNYDSLLLVPAFHRKELQIVGSSDGWDYQVHAAWYFQEVRQRLTCLEELFQLQVTDEELMATFVQLAQDVIHPIKVLVRYT